MVAITAIHHSRASPELALVALLHQVKRYIPLSPAATMIRGRMPSQFREGARRSRLLHRKAARGRRGLDGRRAVVTRFTAALLLGFIRLYCGSCHDLSLAWHLQCVGCDKKILWPSVGLSLGLIGTCWYFFGLIGSCWYVVAFGENGHQTDHRGLRRFTPG